jgi:PAS domain S-box-containing protein
MNKYIHLCLNIALIFIILSSAAADSRKRVLFLASYHPGFPTFFDQLEGIRETLESGEYLLDVEYLDMKRFPDMQSSAPVRNALTEKLKRLPPYDGLISGDDNALHFVLAEQERLFKDVPVVFFGVNDRQLALEQDKNQLLTGVIEAVSMDETIDTMASLFPGIRSVYAIVDETPSGQGDLATYLSLVSAFPGMRLRVLSLGTMSFSELEERLARLEPDSAVLLLSAYLDSEGTVLDFDTSLSRIRSSLNRPLFHLWEHGMGDGVYGGKLVVHREYARQAAGILKGVLENRSGVGDIPVESTSPNIYEFDFNELLRFNTRLTRLPEGSIIINRPDSFFRENIALLITISLIVLLQTLTIIALILNIQRRKEDRRTLEQSEKRFQSIFEYSPVSIWEEDFSEVRDYLYGIQKNGVEDIPAYLDAHPEISERFADMIVVNNANQSAVELNAVESKEQLLGKLSGIKDDDQGYGLRKEVLSLWNGEDGSRREFGFRRRDGREAWGEISLSVAPGAEESWDEVYVSIQDITERKRTEKKLVAALEEKEILLKEIHHRVKNNMAIVTAFLHLASLKARGSEAQMLFQDCEARVHSMARVHEGLYRSDNLRNIDLQGYLRENISYLLEMYNDPSRPVDFRIDSESLPLDIDTLIPLGLLITEAVTNAIKYGIHPEREPIIAVAMTRADSSIQLDIRDNGAGIADFRNLEKIDSLGMKLMHSLAEQIGGTLSIESDSDGTVIRLRFPLS